jgi:hypothetical protein
VRCLSAGLGSGIIRIVVIGGSGHVGSFLVPRLVRAGHEVVDLTRGARAPYVDDEAWSEVEQIAFAFCTGPEEQKQRNLDANPHVAVTTGTTGAGGWNAGEDIVVEGTALRVTAPGRNRRWLTRGSPSTARTGGSRSAARSSSN